MANLSGRHYAMTKSANVCASALLQTQNGNFNRLLTTQGGKLPFEILSLKDLEKNDQIQTWNTIGYLSTFKNFEVHDSQII